MGPAADACRPKAVDHKNRSIGDEAVARALNRANAEANTPQRKGFVKAIERLALKDAAWASELATYVMHEVRNIEKAAGRLLEHDDAHNVGGNDQTA
jgi:hypothetical protein